MARVLFGSDFRVLSIDNLDFFIIHVRETLRVLESPVVFVDVSSTLEGGPKVIEATPLLSALTARLLSKISAASPGGDGHVIHADLDGANGTTAFGLLLGYPVVYWFSEEGDDSGGTCLDGRDLVVCKVKCDSAVDSVGGISFSYPECLSGVLKPAVRRWADLRKVTVLTEVVNREKYAL